MESKFALCVYFNTRERDFYQEYTVKYPFEAFIAGGYFAEINT